jgi:hypothetical protein
LTSGNLYNTELFLGNDDLYVKLANTGNIVLNSNDNAGNSAQLVFEPNGNLTLPGNIQTITTGGFTSNISGIDTGNPTVIVFLSSLVFSGPVSGQVIITDVVGTTEANGIWYFQATDADQFQLFYDAGLTSPVDGTSWSAYVSGGLAVSPGYKNLSITGGNVSVVSNFGAAWTFGDDGNLTLPNIGYVIVTAGIVGSGASPAPTLSGFSSVSALTVAATGNVTGGNLTTLGNVSGNYFIGNGSQLTGMYSNTNVFDYLGSNSNVIITTTGNITADNFIGDGGQLTNLPTPAPIVNSITSNATITPIGSSTQYNVTALATAANIAAPSGTPVDGQKLTIRIIDDGVARALTWDPIYTVIGTTLPTTTTANKYTYVGSIYNSQASTWDVVSVATQA